MNYSLLIGLGSNKGNRELFLNEGLYALKSFFDFEECSPFAESLPVDKEDQPIFLNAVASYALPQNFSPLDVLEILKKIECSLGGTKESYKGPRTLDLDLLFWGNFLFINSLLQIPHPHVFHRPFLTLPIQKLKAYNWLQSSFLFPKRTLA